MKNDNYIVLTESTGAIVEKTNAVDSFYLIVPKLYNDTLQMADYDCVMEYILPISRRNGMIVLTLVDKNYKDDYLLYSLPETTMTTDLTEECGEVEFSISFMTAEISADGSTTVDRVRNSAAPAHLTVVPVSTWLTTSDRALTQLASLYLENKRLVQALSDTAVILANTKADDIKIDTENEKLVLTSNGTIIGDGVGLDVLNQELVETGGANADNGNISIQKI